MIIDMRSDFCLPIRKLIGTQASEIPVWAIGSEGDISSP